MTAVDDHILTLLSCGLFRQVMEQKPISLVMYNALTDFLIYKHIPFDTSYTPGNAKHAESVQVTIYVTPAANIVLQISIDRE